jgi:isoleucyl-tRNA synthetase
LDAELMARWNRLAAIREQVLAEIEPLRKNKEIGSSLQAKVILSATKGELPLLEQYARALPMLFIVSDVEVRAVPTDVEAHEEAKPRVTIERAGGVKCERCWRYVPAVSSEPATAGLCERCQAALAETVNQ